MKTTEFFSEVKKVANDCTLENVFSYRINHDKRFYEIFLHSEPTDKVRTMCEKNGFSITENIGYISKDGEMIARTIWEAMPIDMDDIEYISDDVMKNINENVIIASEQAMVDAGLVECTTRNDYITLWSYELNTVWNKMQWTPIMRVFTVPLKEDIKDDEGNVIAAKSTHKIDSFYGAPISGRLDLRDFLTKRGVTVEEI